MKKGLQHLIVVLLMVCFCNVAEAQKSTIILIRHAEKDTTVQGSTMMQADPPLTAQGKQRAEKLVKVLKKYKIDSVYSTNFVRTKSTVTPLANQNQLDIKTYDHKKLDAFAYQLRQLNNKTVVVAGHSNSTPMLVNALLKEKRYDNLDESVYNKIFIVTIKKGKMKVKIKTY
jgi:broad specificity phosphatase PhoE